jgi:hypothetical protein
VLVIPNTKKKLQKVAKLMTKEKTPNLDGMVIKFFTQFWSLVGVEYFERIFYSIKNGKIPIKHDEKINHIII